MKPTEKKTLHVCPACGAKVYASGRVYCDCNPKAPFRMADASVTYAVDKVLGRRTR